MEEHLPPLDAAITALVEDLDERDMLRDVVVYNAVSLPRPMAWADIGPPRCG